MHHAILALLRRRHAATVACARQPGRPTTSPPAPRPGPSQLHHHHHGQGALPWRKPLFILSAARTRDEFAPLPRVVARGAACCGCYHFHSCCPRLLAAARMPFETRRRVKCIRTPTPERTDLSSNLARLGRRSGQGGQPHPMLLVDGRASSCFWWMAAQAHAVGGWPRTLAPALPLSSPGSIWFCSHHHTASKRVTRQSHVA
jgi:hypothetical protein